MTEQRTRSKTELVEALRSSEQELLAMLGALPEAKFEQGRYENGWNGRQILAHIASIEWTYPRLIDITRQGAAPAEGSASAIDEARRTVPAEAASLPTRAATGGIDAYNQRQVEKRDGASVAELLDEFRRNRATTLAAVEAVDDALLSTPIRSAGGVTGPLADVLYSVAVRHVLTHAEDIAGRTGGVAAQR